MLSFYFGFWLFYLVLTFYFVVDGTSFIFSSAFLFFTIDCFSVFNLLTSSLSVLTSDSKDAICAFNDFICSSFEVISETINSSLFKNFAIASSSISVIVHTDESFTSSTTGDEVSVISSQNEKSDVACTLETTGASSTLAGSSKLKVEVSSCVSNQNEKSQVSCVTDKGVSSILVSSDKTSIS